jgi:hypothetical protein
VDLERQLGHPLKHLSRASGPHATHDPGFSERRGRIFRLHLSGKVDLPASIGNLTDLEELSLAGISLGGGALPATLANLQRVRKLAMRANDFVGVPEGLRAWVAAIRERGGTVEIDHEEWDFQSVSFLLSDFIQQSDQVYYQETFGFDPVEDVILQKNGRYIYQKMVEMQGSPLLAAKGIKFGAEMNAYLTIYESFLIIRYEGAEELVPLYQFDDYIDTEQCNQENPPWDDLLFLNSERVCFSPPWDNFAKLLAIVRKIATEGIQVLNPNLVPAGFHAQIIERIIWSLRRHVPDVVTTTIYGVYLGDTQVSRFLTPPERETGQEWYLKGLRAFYLAEDQIAFLSHQPFRRVASSGVIEKVVAYYQMEGDPADDSPLFPWVLLGRSLSTLLQWEYVQSEWAYPRGGARDLREWFDRYSLEGYFDSQEIDALEELESNYAQVEGTEAAEELDDPAERARRLGLKMQGAVWHKYRDLALSGAEQALSLLPRRAEVHVQLGRISPSSPQARIEFENAVYLDRSCEDAWVALAHYHYRSISARPDPARAENICAEGLQCIPHAPRLQEMRQRYRHLMTHPQDPRVPS